MKLLGEIDPKTQEIVAAARKRHRKMINKAESKLETKTALIQALKDADTTYESTLMGLIEFLKQVQEERVRRKAA